MEYYVKNEAVFDTERLSIKSINKIKSSIEDYCARGKNKNIIKISDSIAFCNIPGKMRKRLIFGFDNTTVIFLLFMEI